MHPLEVAAFDFCFRARGPMRMTGYMGSAWRGGFGQALRHAACVTGLPDRQLEESCVYPYLFETAPDTEGGILAGCDRVPNPFVLAPSWNESHLGREGGETGLRLVLIGRAVEHAGVARQALVEAGLRGLGPDRAALDLVAIDSVSLSPTPPCRERVEIALLTPLRLVEAGRLVGPGALRPRHLLLSLLRRVSTLAERHGGALLDLDYRALKERAEPPEVAAELRWVEWARWSGRQQTLLRMGGLLGSLVLPLAGLEAVLAVSRARPLGPCRRGRDDGARRDADRPGMTDPGAHPRRILLAVTGLTPQVVTETLYALAVKGNPAWVPTEIRIITTRQGVEKAQRTLLSDHPGWFRRLCADYRLPGIAFGAGGIRIIAGPDGKPLDDILDERDNAAVADFITEEVRALTADPSASLYVSIAGGRKTMGFYVGYALSLFGREQDRLSHVLSPALEAQPHVFNRRPIRMQPFIWAMSPLFACAMSSQRTCCKGGRGFRTRSRKHRRPYRGRSTSIHRR